MPDHECEIRAGTPSQFTLKDLCRCTKIVRTGDAVDLGAATLELPRAEILVRSLQQEI